MDQSKILKYMIRKDHVTTKELVEQFGGAYYYNGRKHVSDMISRMVSNGAMVRIKRSVYRAGLSEPRKGHKPGSNQIFLKL